MSVPAVFSASGSLISSAFDAGSDSTWQALSWTASAPAGTSVRLRTRTAASSAGLAGTEWSAWHAANGAPIPNGSGRWLQYEANLTTSNTSITPVLDDVTATYVAASVDTTPPVVTVPADIIAPATGPNGAAVTFSATAVDDVDGALTPTCAPASGSTFPVGATTVTCTATDVAGNAASKTFTVTVTGLVDTTAPVVTGVSSALANGSYRAGQVVPVTVSFSEPVTVTGTPRLTLSTGSPVATAVSYSSGSGTAALTFNYPVAAGNASADLDYAAATSLELNGGTIRDAAANNATLTLAAPGAVGSLGASKNLVIDTTAPVVTVPANITAPATGPNGAVVTFTATAVDNVDGTLTPTCTPASGSTFPVGVTTATCTATDAAGNTRSDSFTVTVTAPVDTTPPAAPTGLIANVTTVAVALDWTDNMETDLAGYRVYRSTTANGPWTRLTASVLTSSAYVDTSAPVGAEVFYQIMSVDLGGLESAPASTSATRTIAFRSDSLAQKGSATTLTIPRPAGLLAKDVMVAAITAGGAPAITPPSGWTLIRTDVSGTTLRQTTYARVADGTEGASFAWTFSKASPVAGVIVAYSGVDVSGTPANPVQSSGGFAATNRTTSIVAPSIPATVDGLLLVGAFGSGTNATFSPPAGMLEQGELAVSSGKAKVAIEIADQMLGTAKDAGTGTRTAVADRSAVAIGQLIALRPAGTTAPPDTEKPTSPTGLTATATSSTQVALTWTASTDNVGVDHYVIERATGEGGLTPIGTSVLTSYSDVTVSASTAYRYRVLAVDTTGNASDPSGTSTVTTPQPPAGSCSVGPPRGPTHRPILCNWRFPPRRWRATSSSPLSTFAARRPLCLRTVGNLFEGMWQGLTSPRPPIGTSQGRASRRPTPGRSPEARWHRASCFPTAAPRVRSRSAAARQIRSPPP